MSVYEITQIKGLKGMYSFQILVVNSFWKTEQYQWPKIMLEELHPNEKHWELRMDIMPEACNFAVAASGCSVFTANFVYVLHKIQLINPVL